MPALKIAIDTARPQDAEHVLRLVKENRLTTDGLLDALATIRVARLDQRIVGTAALEIYADGALLRSVAVSADVRRRGLGASLINAALRVADDLKVHDVFLLTFSAEKYFHRFGFRPVDRHEVPVSVQTSVQFTGACPSSALVMRKRLKALRQGGI